MKSIGIMGGTYDPIHTGHLIVAQSVLEKRNLDEIIFIPCYISPHKQDVLSSSAEHRLEMLKLSLDGYNNFEYSDFEIANKGVSFTLNTLIEFNKLYSNIELIIGYDNIISFDKWYQPDKVLEMCKLVVLKRSVDNPPDIQHKYFEMAEYVDTPMIEISATEIRERVKNNLPIDNLVPQNVKEYIYVNGLYK